MFDLIDLTFKYCIMCHCIYYINLKCFYHLPFIADCRGCNSCYINTCIFWCNPWVMLRLILLTLKQSDKAATNTVCCLYEHVKLPCLVLWVQSLPADESGASQRRKTLQRREKSCPLTLKVSEQHGPITATQDHKSIHFQIYILSERFGV